MFSHAGHVMTLANSIIGVGILAMPFCFQKCGIILASLLLILNNLVTRICCHYLIKTSLLTRRRSFEFLGLHAFGPSGKLLAELCIIGYLIGTCITYFVVVGDLGPQIISKIFALDGEHRHLRTVIMIAVTVLCILPLGMLRNVDSLSALSTASIGFYLCLLLKMVLESASHIVTGVWTDKVVYWEPAGILQCLPIFTMALSCQMQIFEVFGSINNQSLEKLNGIVRNATWICTLVYIAVGCFGYIAFCTQSFSGNILINLSPSFGSDIIKIGFVLSIAFSFPLVIFPCRASIFSLLYRKGIMDSSSYIPEPRFRAITIFIVSLSMCIALVIPSVELVIGLVGSTIGVAICIMFPAASFRKIVKKDSNERMLAQFIVIGGFFLMILGTFANLMAIDEKNSGAHLEEINVDEILLHPPTYLPPVDTVAEIEVKLKNANMFKDMEDKANVESIGAHDALKIIQKSEDAVPAVSAPPKNKQNPLPPLPVDESHGGGVNDKAKAVNKVAEIEARLRAEDDALRNKENEEVKKNAAKDVAKVDEINRNIINNSLKNVINKRKSLSNKTAERDANAQKENANTVESEHHEPLPPLPVAEHKQKAEVAPKPADMEANETQEKLNVHATPQQSDKKQTIDKAALKKDDEVAAEEQKERKGNEDELRKTQNELKKTKELLARTVDELKVELAKQNQETQDMVVEKLSEVVEKVEQIERKVQNNKEQAQPAAQAPHEKGSLLSMLTDSVHAREEQEAHTGVYEPDSYKTGELMKNNDTNSKLDTMLPLPLALLGNATQTKLNEANDGHVKSKETNKPTNATQLLLDRSTSKENVDAIRRDLLQLKAEAADANTVAALQAPVDDISRVRRDANEINYLTEPKLDTIHGPVAMHFQMESIVGRDLKSLNDDDAEEQQVAMAKS